MVKVYDVVRVGDDKVGYFLAVWEASGEELFRLNLLDQKGPSFMLALEQALNHFEGCLHEIISVVNDDQDGEGRTRYTVITRTSE